MYVELRGDMTQPVLLLHGLGCNGAVWDPLANLLLQRGFGVIVPDCIGHGRSPWSPACGLDQQAAAIASLLPRGRPIRIIGHSMGATIGLLLASGRFDVDIADVFAIGLKVNWGDDEINRMGEIRPVRFFATRAEAADRFLRVTGLVWLLDTAHRCVQAGIVETQAGFRLAADPKVFSVVREPVAPALARARATGVPVRLSCGSADSLVDIESLRCWDKDAVVFQGYGHNVHLEARMIADVFLGQPASNG